MNKDINLDGQQQMQMNRLKEYASTMSGLTVGQSNRYECSSAKSRLSDPER